MLRLFLNGPNVAHSSLPIYGTDTHLRACSRAEIRAEGDVHIKHNAPRTQLMSAMNELENGSMETSVAICGSLVAGLGVAVGASPPHIFKASSAIKN